MQEQAPITKTAEKARQGRKGSRMLTVLLFSTVAAGLILAGMWLLLPPAVGN